MCVTSVIYDHYHDKWWDRYWKNHELHPLQPYIPPIPSVPPPTDEEIKEFRTLLARAREYDKKHNQPDCETEEKRRKVKELADLLGIEVGFL